MTTVTSLYNCPCSGSFPVGGPPSYAYGGIASLPATGMPGMQSPYQFRLFESAFFSNSPQVAVLPYSPSTIVAATPTYYPPVNNTTVAPAAPTTVTLAQTSGGAGPGTPTAGPGTPTSLAQTTGPLPPVAVQGSSAFTALPPPGFRANGCGCAVNAYSPLPPSGFMAWQPLLRQFNAPYESLAGQACQGRLW
jgi:hypothetical protein